MVSIFLKAPRPNLLAEETDEKHGTKSVYSHFFQPSPLMSHAPLCRPYLGDFSKLCLSVEIKYCQRSSARSSVMGRGKEKVPEIWVTWTDWTAERKITFLTALKWQKTGSEEVARWDCVLQESRPRSDWMREERALGGDHCNDDKNSGHENLWIRFQSNVVFSFTNSVKAKLN